MKKINAKHVSTAKAGGEYFQVQFEEERDSLVNFFLIQRCFEYYEGEKPDPPYIESDDSRFCGHLKINRLEFNRNRFYIQLANKDKNDLEIVYNIHEKKYQEVKKILKIILSGCDFVKIT